MDRLQEVFYPDGSTTLHYKANYWKKLTGVRPVVALVYGEHTAMEVRGYKNALCPRMGRLFINGVEQ